LSAKRDLRSRRARPRPLDIERLGGPGSLAAAADRRRDPPPCVCCREDPRRRYARPVLEPGLGRTRTGRLWAYVRDDRPFCGPAPPAAVYFYSPDRGGEHPAAHLAHFTGFLQADAYSGFGALYQPRQAGPGLPTIPAITEVACWSH